MGVSVAASVIKSLLFVLTGVYIGISISGFFYQNEDTVTSLATNHIRAGGNTNGDNENYIKTLELLKHSQDEAKRWKSEAQESKENQKSSLDEIRRLEGSCHEKDEQNTDQVFVISGNSANTNNHPFCQSALPHPAPTAMALWNEHILKIFTASRISNDIRFRFHDFTAQLLQIVSPRLPRSVKTVPFDWRPVENALTISWERYKYLQLPKEERDAIEPQNKPRPLKILIMGGSVLVGTNCRIMMRELNFQFQLPKRECNWSYRIGEFINTFFLGDDDKKKRTEQLVEVTKVAMGGTNTGTGSVIWQFDLIPEVARNPDIVLNAYPTNDMHILTVMEAESSNTTLRDKTFEMLQGFVRQVMQTKHCPADSSASSSSNDSNNEPIPPLLLHMDDYLGNEQRKIWDTTELTQGAQVLANYYGFVSMSYADVVREFVYGDTYEKWFSSEWWVPEGGKKKNLIFDRQIHPGMGMHISSMWVTVYNLLHLASLYCSIPTGALVHQANNNITEYQAGLWGLPDLQMAYKQPMGKPRPQPKGLPPMLTKDLLLEDITSLWRQQSGAFVTDEEEQQEQEETDTSALSCKLDQTNKDGVASMPRVKCPFSWVSGLSLQQNNVTFVKEYFLVQSSIWEGWELSGDGDKLGFVPSPGAAKDADARIILDFVYSQKIQSVTFFFMKSYGTKWENSELEAKIWSAPSSPGQQQVLLDERYILGTHSKNTSEMYTEEIVLSERVDAGQKFQVEFKLVGGETFKLMGLAVCS
uniref:Uncharacterized protein n=1 Tax=Pseudo-nitzschia australis TaxID=44445 RepID=A0A7S4AQF9_9STRA|mmetsp:Transcript_17294/g.37888  ORF Transcript_17294/g.37888 Transcript_17294/m.37888 type:complete len:757 (-) Transcript_17294:810-3080(-)|eukprot:CAMPEP_0168255578 /NCGR_PEP_ID=MMETSP0141_2-20121125/5336_1 /TAXON_ID=44445 /ORGANISM="Pseudo-nitzschia australis, Strain 10249 10 AB" /LENGTH=756 /DNA_ID=CAMNT_0008192101 /DNA_START=81 /DNA_END=2351 /DNA_ORIENTATION=-